MVEFGAKLSLKDNMSATLVKNLKTQKQFSEQVNRTSNNIKALGKTKANPTVNLKDKASKMLTKVKTSLKSVGKTIAKPFIYVKDNASKIIKKVGDGLKALGKTTAKVAVAIKDGATAGLNKIKSLLGTLAKGVTIAVGVAGAGLTALTAGSINEGAKLQQSKGGVETLYKGKEGDGGVVDTVIANANKAYKTAGLSANAYMETVTGFSASLLSSLGGDTEKSAKIADMAIIDMADNANKFGTDMESIKTAYAGFAKQNYTMLDNLKLGYGGTKEEMQRLLKDAQKITGVKYDISNLADVYSAIHVIQDKLGVAGATADEAEKTFSGSFSAMKASFQNFLGALSTGGNIEGTIQEMVNSASIFLLNNAIPMLGNIFKALPSAIVTAVRTSAPKLKELGGTIVSGVGQTIRGMLPKSMQGSFMQAFYSSISIVKTYVKVFKSVFDQIAPVISQVASQIAPIFSKIASTFGKIAPVIGDLSVKVFGTIGNVVGAFAGAIGNSLPSIEGIISGVSEAIGAIFPIIGDLGGFVADIFPTILGVIESCIPVITPIISTLGDVFKAVIPVATSIIKTFAGIIQQVLPVVSQIFSSVGSVVMPIIQAIAGVVQSFMPIISNVITIVVGAIQAVMPTFTSIFSSIGEKVVQIVGVVQKHMPLIQNIFEAVSGAISQAMPIVASVISGAWAIISPIIDIAIGIFDTLLSVVERVFPKIKDVISDVWEFLEPIFGGIADGLSAVGDGIDAVKDWAGGAIDTVGGWLGFAYGKDRVPYDNYPAILHQGEKVLTRNQADQYERHTSTRGVQLTQSITEVPRDSDVNRNAPTQPPVQAQPTPNHKSTTVLIDKLADTVVIEKEADVDKVVEDMIIKFRKLVPNMA